MNFAYQNIIRDLENDQRRRKQNTEFLFNQLNGLITELGYLDQMNFDQMIEGVHVIIGQYEKLNKELLINDDQFIQAIKHQLFEYQQFMAEVGQMISIDVKRLVEDNVYAEGANQSYTRMRHRMRQRESRK